MYLCVNGWQQQYNTVTGDVLCVKWCVDWRVTDVWLLFRLNRMWRQARSHWLTRTWSMRRWETLLQHHCRITSVQHCLGTGEGKGAQRPERRITGDAEMSQQCHKYFFQYSTFPSKRPQTCFLPWAPSNLCMPLVRNARLLCKTSLITAQLLLFVWPVDHTRKWRDDWAGLVATPIAGCYANSRSRDRVGRVFHVTYVRQVYHVGLRLRALEKCNRRLVQCWGLVVKVQHMQYVRQLQVQMGGPYAALLYNRA